MRKYWKIILMVLLTLILVLIVQNQFKKSEPIFKDFEEREYLFAEKIKQDVNLGNYYSFMDSLVSHYDTLTPYDLNEYLIVHRNKWIIDSLESTDYYQRIERNEFVYDFSKLVIIKENDMIYIPREEFVDNWNERQGNILIDVNIPEFKLRILEKDSIIYTFPIRVGRDEEKYLAMADNFVDLKTKPGKGRIVRINKKARYVNPADNKEYFTTKRDDGKRTLLPITPWLEPEINGTRYGQLFHPTTNPKTLGKAYSNGCVGMREGDAWRLYYFAPLGTKVNIRYDLTIKNEDGENIELKDIYKWKNRIDRKKFVASLLSHPNAESYCYCN